ncbi:MAG: hypothetical protein GWQ08_23555 [Verrucomicrobiaceae bacterium]|nr:hypothetical protein [Verrucomicrobiaceae bacterium]
MKKPLGYPILTLSLGIALTSCNKPSDENEFLSENDSAVEEELAADIEAKEAERKARKAKMEAIMAKMRKNDSSAAEETNVSKSKSSGTVEDDESKDSDSGLSDEQWLEIEDRLVARGAARGLNLGTIQTQDGRTFSDAVVQDADALGITISHGGSVVQLGYEVLSPPLKLRFRYSQEEAKQAAEGTSHPPLPIARRRDVKRRINEAQIAAAQADSSAFEATLEAQMAAEKAASAAASARSKNARGKRAQIDKQLNLSRVSLVKARETLEALIENADIVRHGPKNTNIRRAGIDTPQTRAADKEIEDQRQKIIAIEAKIAELDAERIGL